MDFSTYDPENGPYYDEMLEAVGRPRGGFEKIVEGLGALGSALGQRQKAAEQAFLTAGITFTLRDEQGEGTERIFPFDIVPRIIAAKEWDGIERGIKQRIVALNLFLRDIYGEQRILKDKVVPEYLIKSCAEFREPCIGLNPPRGIWCHVSGTDLVRDKSGQFHVLEDNVRCPSGVSYVLENRHILKRTLPRVFESVHIRPVDDYPMRLRQMLRYLGQARVAKPRVVVLTPGRFNSAYFEHAFLAQQMGVELVEAADLVVLDEFVHMRTTSGLARVDVIYRRVGDDYLDPKVFRQDSLLGIPGVMGVFQKGNVALANAPGTGVADDKAIYAYVESIIKYYLDEDAILPNVPTFICSEEKQRQHVIENIADLVVKATDGAGGYGMLIGPHATSDERREFIERIKKNPRGYIAQPTLSLSRAPTIVQQQFEPRHVDLRPFALYGEDVYVQPGGLTRVALRKGSLVVNSSQGGGSKDTWVLEE
ncbi:MAG TPA: circularly permuted type 2 ATP-grasp protein [Polyangiaceae bacterium]